ncbi:MAG TPA: UDP-N-acetylglucosamine 2-epimerase (non-hydrolyzing) [Methanobacterium sp.]
MTIIGTRPEIIRLSRVMDLLDEVVNHVIVHTGQNYDYELNEIFFNDLRLRKPDYFLNVNTSTLGKVLGETLIKTEEILLKERPDAVLILGDTNSSISGIIAKRLKIPIYHMEAGNRCFDFNVPEEINRRIIDHIADFNLVYTENARRHLLSEGLPHRQIYLTGSPMFEVINNFKENILNSKILEKLDLKKAEYFLVSVHREENVDNQENLAKILTFLNQLAAIYNKRIIISTHPRTKKRIDVLANTEMSNLVEFNKPFGFFDFVQLEINAICTISDSGTISEESAILNFPAVTIREATERPESLDCGTITLTGLDCDTLLDSIQLAIKESKEKVPRQIPKEYEISNTSWRVVKLIIGTAKLISKWENINLDHSKIKSVDCKNNIRDFGN